MEKNNLLQYYEAVYLNTSQCPLVNMGTFF